ncbi:MAG: LamG domain-containing protein [Bacteroidia bacterium]|nr:LamG domain-containing protein [Bacteroidia bacterium]
MKFFYLFLLVFISGLCEKKNKLHPDLQLGEFGAFYTKINSGEEFQKFSRTGPFADIVVDLGADIGAVVFWRGTGYLPYLMTPAGEKISFSEVIPRKGDGNDLMPDRTNHYSVVRIIENSPEKVVVHWRYLPEFSGGNPHKNVDVTNFCEEYFTFMEDGEVIRTIRKGDKKIDNWQDPSNLIKQSLRISKKGIKVEKEFPAKKTYVATAIEGNPVIEGSVVEPAVWFKFDEAKGDTITESVSGLEMTIPGNKTQWRKGVSGAAIQFDGHKNFVSFPAPNAPRIDKAITLEGWAAMAAYPWSWTTIVQQMDDVPEIRKFEVDENKELPWNERFKVIYQKEDDKGYFLGINGMGQAGFKIRVNGAWEELTSELTLKKDIIYHFAATYEKATGKMLLYINGKLDSEKQIAKADIETSSKDILVGKGIDRAQIAPVRKNTFPAPYTFDGIIDEVKIYTLALRADEIEQSYKNYGVAPGAMADMEVRKIPVSKDLDRFGARYTFLKFYDSWENLWRTGEHADVVVEFEENPGKVIFWRGVSYIEMMVNELNQFYSNEFNETWNTSGGEGCQEPMSDKGVYASHIKIIENTPARVVLEWRFALQDVNYVLANYENETGWGDWASWYYYIYPDGITVKVQQLWSSGEKLNHEWQESMAIMGPNQHPHDIISRSQTLTFVGLDGSNVTFDWLNKPPTTSEVDEKARGKPIQIINYKGQYDPVTIVQENLGYNVYDGEITDYAVFCTWNHWPVAQQPSDGRYSLFPDRASHSSLTHIYYPVYEAISKKESETPYQKKIMMQGMLSMKPPELAVLANSWINPPPLINAKGCSGVYDKTQRAYIIKPDAQQVSFTLECSESNPLYNAAIIIKNWNNNSDATLTVNGIQHPVKQGIFRDVNGTKTLAIWVEKTAEEKIDFVIRKQTGSKN